MGPDTLELNITGLQANTMYIVWIKAFTSKGEGGNTSISQHAIKTSKSIEGDFRERTLVYVPNQASIVFSRH